MNTRPGVTLAIAGLVSASLVIGPAAQTADAPESLDSSDASGSATRSRKPVSPEATQDEPFQSVPDLDDVKALMKQGAYREALQMVNRLLADDPDQPRAQAYRSICERRLRDTAQFQPLTKDELHGLRERLEAEQEQQRRAAEQQQALERELAKEQARWKEELASAQQETIRARQAQEREAARQAAEQRRLAAPPPSPEPPPGPAVPTEEPEPIPSAAPMKEELPAVAVTPSAEAPPEDAAERPVTEPSEAVELEPVTVPAAPAPADTAQEPAGEPSVAPPPPGAVQIFADRMAMSPDRNLARAEGNVRIVFDDGVMFADRVTVFTDTHDLYAQGRVRMERGLEVFRGELAHYNSKTKKGRFLEGTAFQDPWYEHGRVVEHVAEGVMRVSPGYLTSCELEPPHFRFQGQRTIVFAEDKLARGRHVTLFVDEFPLLYLPRLTVADRQMPFYIIPGKKKPWEQFVLMGYRSDARVLPIDAEQKTTTKVDWRRAFGWGVGVDHQIQSPDIGKGLLKLYYNEERNIRRPEDDLPKGADIHRYRVLWRHHWFPRPNTSVVTDLQEYSDADFRQELLFREEYVNETHPESFVSMITNESGHTVSVLARKRLNRFQGVTEALPQITHQIRPQQIGQTNWFVDSKADFANFNEKQAHSEIDSDMIRVDGFEQLSYAMNWFRPVLVTPKAGMRQTYYTKDKQGSDRGGKRNVLAGQFTTGADASLKLFRIVPVATNAYGLNLNWLRHVVTPTVAYSYVHQPTVPNELLNFSAASSPTNQITFGLENKLQTKRPRGAKKKLQGVDLARATVSIPYTFHGHGNKDGGQLGDWAFDIELYPWPWLRFETDWKYPSHFQKGSRDERLTAWNFDLIVVGGHGEPEAVDAPDIQAPAPRVFEPGPQRTLPLLPQGQWYVGLGHRYSHNDKTEEVIQFDWRLTEKWQIGTFHRITWKEVAGGSKRFNHVREVQYTLTRDLHDWVGELVYRLDREFGEEIFLTLTLKAYPELPIELETSYHQPKFGSQSSPFSPVLRQ